MKTFEIYLSLIESIQIASRKRKGEVEIVKESIKNINNLTWGPNIKVKTGFCHQKPYAFFINPTKVFTKVKTELGDYLFIIKYLDNDIIIDNRALFFQAKYNKTNTQFDIELHQYFFYNQIKNIEFKFGNTIYENLNIKPIIWRNLSKENSFGDYFLIGDKFVLDVNTFGLSNQYEHKRAGHFSFESHYILDCWRSFREYNLLCCHKSPLFDFLGPNGKGNRIKGDFQVFINLIYKKLNIIPDPPDENIGFWEENSQGGFGLIEITINNTENLK